jgi:hypothetical protein
MKVLAWSLLTLSIALQAPAGKKANCPEKQTLAPDGSVVFVDCHGKVTETRSNAPRTEAPPQLKGPESRLAIPPDSPAAQTYLESLRAEFQYDIDSLAHRRKVLDWQHTSSIVIFWVVVLLVLGGLVLAALQFWGAMRAQLLHTQLVAAGPAALSTATTATASTSVSGASNAAPAVPASTAPSAPDTSASTFEASLKGIKISSSVIGLIVLAMSMAFFYLYLKFVYPIQTLGGR